jgi:N-methylhydantoinase A
VYSLDIDIGGTFTDGFFTDGVGVRTAKVLTTVHDVTEGFMDCISLGSRLFDVRLDDFLRRTNVARMSTTIGTNLLVQRKGARIGLLVTAGAERGLYAAAEAAAFGRVIERDMVRTIGEAIVETGEIIATPNAEEVLAAVRDLIHQGAQIIVVSLRNAWRNPENERAVRAIIRDRYPIHYLRSVPVQLGSEIVHDRDDHARTNSAVLNAYIHADMARILFRAEDKLRSAGYEKPLLIVHASGGNARVARTIALNTLHSGPAVAIKGAAIVADFLDLDHVVSADMGGTSFDIGVVVNRRASLDLAPQVEGMPIATPAIRVDSVGIGGGSIARLEGDRRLLVGPESAGSAPGPAAYGKGGTEPTVTDANVVLGFIDPDFFLGGQMKLDSEAARRVIDRRIARKLQISVEQAAFDIRRVASQRMAKEISDRLTAADLRASEVALFSVGGAGPLHACDIAAAVGLRGAVAFSFGSVFSAFGGSNTDVQHLYRHTFAEPAATKESLAAAIGALALQARRDMQGEGFSPQAVGLRVEARVGNEIVTETARGDSEGLLVEGLFDGLRGASIQSVQLVAEAAVPHWRLQRHLSVSRRPQPKARRLVRWNRERAMETPIFDRELLQPGARVEGPAVVEGSDTTYAILPDWALQVDEYGCFLFSPRSGWSVHARHDAAEPADAR